MPVYRAEEFEVEISRHATLLDTNVLVAAFLPSDEKYAPAKVFLDIWEDQFLIPMSVVVEAWGMLTARQRDLRSRHEFLAWLRNPGTPIAILPQMTDRFADVPDLVKSMDVDCVDALLLCLASDLTEQCNLSPPVLIATFDIRDFWRCALDGRFKFKLLHPESLDEYDVV